MTVIIDYGASNLKSVEKAFEYIGYPSKITSNLYDIINADRLILPGNGAFGDCMACLNKTGLLDAIKTFIQKERPFLGICIGMQILFEKSSEFGNHTGLGLIKGRVERFPEDVIKQGGKIPHMGWNSVKAAESSKLFKNIPQNTYFYFVHSYKAVPEENFTAGECDYYGLFPAATEKENIFGVQFHPEKSLKGGLKLLDNFCKI